MTILVIPINAQYKQSVNLKLNCEVKKFILVEVNVMKNELNFCYPFFLYADLNFINCFSSVYLYLRRVGEVEEYVCAERQGKSCSRCGNCNANFFTLFEAVTGRYVLRERWDGIPTKMQDEISKMEIDKLIDFIVGFTGYDYKKATDSYQKNIITSIDINKPVLAKIKNAELNPFRVITGYDGESLLCPDFSSSANPPDCAPTYEEIECLYIFSDKIPQKYTFLDVLKRFEKIMEFNISEGLWDEYIQKLDYVKNKFWELDVAEIQRRFRKLAETLDHLFSHYPIHLLQQAFGNKSILEMMGIDTKRLNNFLNVIGSATDTIHNRAWQGKGLNHLCDWDKWNCGGQDEFGFCCAAVQTVESIKECDVQMLTATKEAIRILSE